LKAHDPLAFLAAVVQKIEAAANDRARLPALLDALADSEIFASTILFAARGNVFIAAGTRGADTSSARRWLKWPLRRLFATMRPRRIVHPERGETAMAIPFDYGGERVVVVAVLGEQARDSELDPFFEALRYFRAGGVTNEPASSENVPLSPIDPQMIAFGLCPELRNAIESMLARRAWALRVLESYSHLKVELASSRPDVLLFDADHRPYPLGELIGVHTALPEATRLVIFGGRLPADVERQALADAVLDHDAAEVEIFAVLKRFARQVPELRRTRLREMTTGAEMALKASRTPAELSVVGARQAAEVMSSGWASLHLVSESGASYRAEYPRQGEAILTALPKAFLSDTPVFQFRADERFFQEVSDDLRAVAAISRLQPVSAASLPLRNGSARYGALVSISRSAPVDSTAFEALEGYARIITGRFEEFMRAAAMVQSFERRGAWEYVRHGQLELAVYRSRSSSTAWDYRVVRPDLGILSVGDGAPAAAVDGSLASGHAVESSLAQFVALASERSFMAACNPVTRTIAYAAAGFPVPLLFDAAGPAGAVSVQGAVASGTVAVVPPAGLLVWDNALRRWMMCENIDSASITETLQDLRPPGIAIVITSL
jgi:hypothetical protein